MKQIAKVLESLPTTPPFRNDESRPVSTTIITPRSVQSESSKKRINRDRSKTVISNKRLVEEN